MQDLKNKNINDDDIIVLNKSDNLHPDTKKWLINNNLITISVKEKLNINKLLENLTKKIKTKYDWNKGFAISKERHLIEIESIAKFLNRFDINDDLIIACENLRLAANALSRITGKIDIEEILDKIFKEFCIGK